MTNQQHGNSNQVSDNEGAYVSSNGGIIRQYANIILQRTKLTNNDTKTTASLNQSVYMDSGSGTNDDETINVHALGSDSF